MSGFVHWRLAKDLFDSLTPELQEVVHESARQAQIEVNPLVEQDDYDMLQAMEDYGIQVTRLTEEQLVPWIEHGRSIWPAMADECGADAIEYVIEKTR